METSGVHRRCPALLAALCLGLGIVCSEFLAPPTGLWLTGMVSCWVVGLLVYRRGAADRIASWMLCICLFALGGIRHHQDTRLLPANDIRQAHVYGSKGELTAWLDHDPETLEDGRRRVRVRAEIFCADDGDCRELSGDILLTVRSEVTQFTTRAGDRLRILCRILKPQPARNPGEFDYQRFLAQRHDLHATASIYHNSDILESSPGPTTRWQQYLIRPIRASLRSSFTAYLDGAPAALLVGMLLGDKHAIPASVKSQFRTTGLAHALVISGLHVGLIVVFLLTLLRVARVPDAIACCVTVALLVIYAFVTQMQAPVVRASLMAAIVLLGRAVELRGSVLNSLGLAASVLMVAQPTSLLTLSFQLSFAATFAIVTLHGPFMSLWPY